MIEKYKKLLQDSEDALLVGGDDAGKDIQDSYMKEPVEEALILMYLFREYDQRLFFDIAKKMPNREIFVKFIDYYTAKFPSQENVNLYSWSEVKKYQKDLKETYSDLVEYIKSTKQKD